MALCAFRRARLSALGEHAMSSTRVLHVCVGRAKQVTFGAQHFLSAIGKQPAGAGAVAVGPLGLAGDEQADPTVHGGPSKAVYAYPGEHHAFWRTVRAQARVAAWGDPVPPGLFGENLLLEGLVETQLWIGDRLRLPGCVLAVSEPRFPCAKFNAAMGFAQATRLMVQSGYCGAYLAVIEPGHVQAGDEFELLPGPREVSLGELFRARARA
jgi:MOSC domain-containing protein YiiM